MDWGDFLLDAGDMIRDEYIERTSNFPAVDEWCQLEDAGGRPYYFNKRTLASQWEPVGIYAESYASGGSAQEQQQHPEL